MKYIYAGVNIDKDTKLIKINRLWVENGSNGHLLSKISSGKVNL